VKQIAVLSGKGGTGKTLIAAALVRWLNTGAVAADADVEAANLGLFLAGRTVSEETLSAGQYAAVNDALCNGCGECAQICRFDAVRMTPDAARIDPLHCEGCRACLIVCARGAIDMMPRQTGFIRVQEWDGGVLVAGELLPARDNSGRMVTAVVDRARQIAAERSAPFVVVDGPPGIGCPVHACLSLTDQVLAVTEPTVSGCSDLQRLLDLCDLRGIPAAVLLNRWMSGWEHPPVVEQLCEERHIPFLGRIPFCRDIPAASMRRLTPLAQPLTAPLLQEAFRALCEQMAC
jgi:MinD superfamily P-loop ATPase